jgi:NAD(P)-dependent dehydrogenase (short-subunit alcohol dehydrogenase family)
MTTVLITGAGRGLGLAAAREAARRNARVLLAGRSLERMRPVAAAVGGEAVAMDMASLASVREAARSLPAVDALVANAGVQNPGPRRMTGDGFEEPFQVNHLAHLVLIDELIARGDGGPRRIVLIGSATHDPTVRHRMPAPMEGPLPEIAAGGPAGRDAPADGRRRYTTSKLLITASASALARELPDRWVACLDPGLMPGTGLARDYAGWQRVLWSTVGRALVVLPFASSPERSGRTLVRLLLDEPAPAPSGAVVDHRLRPAAVSRRAADEAFAGQALRESRGLLARSGPA